MNYLTGIKVAIIDPSGFTLPYDHCLATALAERGCQVLLATTSVPSRVGPQPKIYERWDRFYSISNKLPRGRLRTYLKGCEHPFGMVKLYRYLRYWRPNVIHFQWVPFPAVDLLFLQRFRKIAPLVLTVHDTEPFHGAPSSRFQLLGSKSVFKYFDQYIVHTRYSKDELIGQMMLPAERVTVVPHGVFDYYREMIGDLNRSEQVYCIKNKDKKKVLLFGALKPYKGVDVLLEAFALLPETVAKNTVLQIVGYPMMPIESLKSLAQNLGIEKKVFWDLRFVEDIEVAAYFASTDVVVLPYRRIDQSGVLMVALAFRKPIVASRVGGFSEIISNGVHGFLVEPGDAASLAQALARILNDDTLRTQMAGAVERLACEELSWESIASKTLEVYGYCQQRAQK